MNEAFCPRDRHCECEGAPNRSFWKSFLRKSFGGTKVRHYGVQTVRRQALSAGVEFIRMIFAQKFGSGEPVRKRFAFSRTVVRSCFADLKISALLFDFVPENQYGEHQLPQHKSGYLHRIKRKLRAVSPYGLFLCGFGKAETALKHWNFSHTQELFKCAAKSVFWFRVRPFRSVCWFHRAHIKIRGLPNSFFAEQVLA